MRLRIWLTAGGWWVTAAAGLAQPPTDLPPVVPLRNPSPPLLPVPPAAAPVRPDCADCPPPAGPPVEYDRSLLYLPDRLPEAPRGPTPPPPEEQRLWAAGGVFLGWSSGAPAAPLLLGGQGPATRVLFGDAALEGPFRPGFRLDAGAWFDDARTWGAEAGGLYLPQSGGQRSVISTGNPGLSLPVVTAPGATPTPFTLADPSGGAAFVADWSSRFAAADVDVWRELYRGDGLRLAGTAGYRFAYLGESLTVRQAGFATQLGPVRFLDRADTTNFFHGGQLGVSGGWRADRWSVDLTAEVGLGAVFARSDVSGSTAAGGLVLPGGFAARPGNAGADSDVRFAALPTLSAMISRQVTDHGKVFAGYTLHYLNGVTRPGDALGPAGDPAGLGLGLRRPAGGSDFWVQGVNVGLEWEY